MKTRRHALLAIALLTAALLAVPRLAGAVTQDITLTANVPGICTISDSSSPTAVAQDLTIDATGRVSTSTVSFNFPFVCNKTATLELASINGGLTGPTVVSGYENKINYIARSSGVFPAITLNTALPSAPLPGGGSPYVSTSAGAASGTLTIAITPAANLNPLVSGGYTETLRLTVLPTQ